MKELLNYNLKDIAEQCKIYNGLLTSQRRGVDKPTKMLPIDRFLPHAVASFSSQVQPIKNPSTSLYSPSLTYKEMEAQLQYLLQIIYYTKRSDLMKDSAAKNPSFAGLTPIFLYAMKDKYGIGYEEWDKEDSYFKVLVSKQQHDLLVDIPGTEEDWLDKDRIATFREESLGDKPLAGWMSKGITLDDGTKLSNYSLKLKVLLQTWIANASLRVPEAMILSLWDWDKTPEPFDITIELPAAAADIAPIIEDALPWD